MLISCQGEKAREWHTADSTSVAASADTSGVWQFDAEEYLVERLSLLEAEAPSAGSERILREFDKVINGWVTDSLAQAFWCQVDRDYGIVEIPLVVEIGHPDDEAVYITRGIVDTKRGPLLVKSKMVTAQRSPALQYSWLSQKEYEDIMTRLSEQFGIFQLESDFHLGAENPPMTAVEVRHRGQHRVVLFSFYHKPSSAAARQMFDYLDSLFCWGQGGGEAGKR